MLFSYVTYNEDSNPRIEVFKLWWKPQNFLEDQWAIIIVASTELSTILLYYVSSFLLCIKYENNKISKKSWYNDVEAENYSGNKFEDRQDYMVWDYVGYQK